MPPTLNVIDPILSACVLGLIAAVGHLWRQNNRLGRLLDRLNRRLGRLQGLAHAVKGCHVKACPMRHTFESAETEEDDDEDEETAP
jgi:hypothetical protein